jgi:hypothetical protein
VNYEELVVAVEALPVPHNSDEYRGAVLALLHAANGIPSDEEESHTLRARALTDAVDRSEVVVVGGEAALRRENRRLTADIERLRLTLLDCAREVGEDVSDAHHQLTTPSIEALALEAVSRFRSACEHDAAARVLAKSDGSDSGAAA